MKRRMNASASIVAASPAEARQQFLSSRMELCAVLALALIERAVCWFQRPPDMGLFLEPWLAHIVHYGPIAAFAHPFSNYEPAYLYVLAIGSLADALLAPMTIIKLLSIAGTLFLTFALTDLAKASGADRRAALLVLILPSVAINDALLGQCDALWAGSCVFALAAVMRGQTVRSLIWCGVAISFKAQAAFIAPVIVGAMAGRRLPLWQWAIPALVFLASLVPAWLAGWPAMQLLTVYLGQASLDQLAGRLGNPWMIATVFGDAKPAHVFWLGYAAAGASALAIGTLAAQNWRDPRTLLVLGALSGTVLPFFLPKMLERYYFLGDILALGAAITIRTKAAGFAFRAIQVASILSLITLIYFFYDPWPALGGTIAAAAAIVAMCAMLPPLRAPLRLRPA